MPSSGCCDQRNIHVQLMLVASPIRKEGAQGWDWLQALSLRKEGVESPVEDLSMSSFVYDDQRSMVDLLEYDALPSRGVKECRHRYQSATPACLGLEILPMWLWVWGLRLGCEMVLALLIIERWVCWY